MVCALWVVARCWDFYLIGIGIRWRIFRQREADPFHLKGLLWPAGVENGAGVRMESEGWEAQLEATEAALGEGRWPLGTRMVLIRKGYRIYG